MPECVRDVAQALCALLLFAAALAAILSFSSPIDAARISATPAEKGAL